MSRLDRDEFTSSEVADSSGREQESCLVNEPGLCSLVPSSRKPEAKAFKRRVAHEVLPAIRKTGGHMAAAVAVERGYLYNFVPEPYEDPLAGDLEDARAELMRLSVKRAS